MLQDLHEFIISAKKATYVGSGGATAPSRQGSLDLIYEAPPFVYRDSYFGGTDFIGQEVVWQKIEPIWAMNYYGYILRPDLITPTHAGNTLKAALSLPHAQGRLLDNFEFRNYKITSQGDISRFVGVEIITVDGALAYQLDYHGGLIKP
jgi:Domain of unknown function (DUF5680)